VIESELTRLAGRERVAAALVARRWSHLVGPELAAHTMPDAVQNGVLTVLVRDHIWLQQLAYFRTEITRKVIHVTNGAIRRIFFQVGIRDAAALKPRSDSASLETVKAPPDTEDVFEAFHRVARAAERRRKRLEV
jgi:hypothetical protein